GLCEALHTKDEVAFVFAHELAHIAKGHPEKRNGYVATLYFRWVRNRQGANPYADFLPQMAWYQFHKDKQAEIDEFCRAQEEEADKLAHGYLSVVGSPYKAGAGADSMAHFKDWDWAMFGDSRPEGTTHPPYALRASALRDV